MIKVNILTGFFGSGKTTLISNIIKYEHLKNRIAIIQNEFSEEMGIEKDTLLDSDGNDLGNLIEMPNGCLCCVVKDNLVVFIENLIKKKTDIDLVLIESHGYTDVSNLIKKFWLDKELESPVMLNSIICLIDCFNYLKNKQENEDLFFNQIISADKVILNKIDLLKDQSEIERIKNEIYEINPLANLITCQYSSISIEYFFEESQNTNINKFEQEIFGEKIKEKCCDYHHKNEIDCKHLTLIENLVLRTNIESLNQLDKTIGGILWDLSEEFDFKIIRFKGLIKANIENNAKELKFYSLQGLYDLYEFTEIKVNEKNNLFNNDKNGEFQSKILFIGKKLNKNQQILNNVLNPKKEKISI